MVVRSVRVVASDARSSSPDAALAPYEIVRSLGSRLTPVHAARHPQDAGKALVVVIERFAGAANAPPIVERAKRIATLAGPNVARVREVSVRGDDLFVVGDFLDGEKLLSLWRFDDKRMPLEVALRVIIDALTGLGALHGLRDANQQPMRLAHGELSPSTIVLCVDGAARVLHAVARHMPEAAVDPTSVPYLAPEVHAGEAFDARADVFGAGVVLWEALSGQPLFTEVDGAAMAARVRTRPLAPARAPDKAPWAKGLVEVAAKALAASPDDRWPTAAAMAAEIRRAAGLKLAPASAAAAYVKGAAGDRIKMRRAAIETGAAPSVAARAPSDPPPVAIPRSSSTLRPPDVVRTPPSAPLAADAPAPPPTPLEPIELSSDVLEAAPPSLPAQTAPESVPLPSGAPEYATAIDVPFSIPTPRTPDIADAPFRAPADARMVTSPSLEKEARRAARAELTRKIVLATIGGVGVLIFVLAGVRVVRSRDEVEALPSAAVATPTPTATPTPIAITTATPTLTAPTPTNLPPVAAAPTAPKRPPPAAAAAARPAPARPKPTFDPNSL